MIISITHEHDLDGLGSQAIIKRYFDKISDEEIKLFDANYSNFIEVLKGQLSSIKDPTKLIISDIGFNKSFKVIFDLFKSAKEKNCNILWFDHHIVDASIKKKISTYIDVYINDSMRCAAEIIKDYFLPQDVVAIKISEFARDTDFKTEKFKLASDIQLIIGYNIGKKGYEKRRELVKLLSEGKFDDKWFDNQLNELKDWIRQESEFAFQNVNHINIPNFGDIYISYAQLGGGKITQILKNKYPNARAYIGIDTRYDEIIIHSEFVNCREFAMHFDGGGHEDRAGFKHPNTFSDEKKLSNIFIQDIRNILPKFRKETS
jgi:oligoribonuclease NrnB/cAMP/cGMP phosphodiesterase (DHH superfamily)